MKFLGRGKGLLFLLALTLFVVTACQTPWSGNKEQQIVKSPQKGDNEKVTVIPQEDSKEYRNIHSDKPSPTRGYIQYGVDNRVDIDEMETGLMRLSKGTYNPDTYYFQDGRYLTPKDIDGMLARKGDANYPNGLNPPLGKKGDLGERASENPKILSYVLEQDYLKKDSKNTYKLGGISLAISVNSVYSENLFNKDDGKTYTADVTIDQSEAMAKGKEYAKQVVQRVRKVKGLENVPIFIALYIESQPGSFIPGHFYAKANVGSGQYQIDKWASVNEQYVLFPSTNAAKKFMGDSNKFDKFKTEVEKYFPNSIGVIGKGFYQNGEINNLMITINIRFYDKSEVITFTNYVNAMLKTKFAFSQDLPVTIYINSNDQPEAIIVKKSDMDEPFVYVYQDYK